MENIQVCNTLILWCIPTFRRGEEGVGGAGWLLKQIRLFVSFVSQIQVSQIQNFTIVSVTQGPSFSCWCVLDLPGQTHKYTGWNCNKRWSYKKFSNSWRKNRRAFLTWPKNARKMFLILYSTNWPNFISWLNLLLDILVNMNIAFVC